MTGAAFWFLDKSLIRPPENSGFSVTVLSFRSSPSIERRSKGRAWREPLGGGSEILSRLACWTAPPRVQSLDLEAIEPKRSPGLRPASRGRVGSFPSVRTRGRGPRELLSGQVLSLK